MWRLALSFVIAAVGGIPLGILMGLSPLADELIDPVVELLRPISGIAWLPLALFIFGVGNELPIFIMTCVALFPILLNTLSGVRQTDPTLIRAARTMGASGAGSSSARSSCRRRCRASWSASGSPAAPAGRRWSRPSWSARRAVSASRSSGIASS